MIGWAIVPRDDLFKKLHERADSFKSVRAVAPSGRRATATAQLTGPGSPPASAQVVTAALWWLSFWASGSDRISAVAQAMQLREYLELVQKTGSWVLHRDLLTGHLYPDSVELKRVYQSAVVEARDHAPAYSGLRIALRGCLSSGSRDVILRKRGCCLRHCCILHVLPCCNFPLVFMELCGFTDVRMVLQNAGLGRRYLAVHTCRGCIALACCQRGRIQHGWV